MRILSNRFGPGLGHKFRGTVAKFAPLAALLLLSALWALAALRSDLLPNVFPMDLPAWQRQAMPFAMLTMVAAAVTHRAPWPRGRQLWSAVLVGLGLFVAPAWLVASSQDRLSSYTRTALLTLVPLFTVVFEPYLTIDRHPVKTQTRGGLVAALAAVAGAVCIFPLEIPNTLSSGVAFGGVVLAAACAAAANCHAVLVAELHSSRFGSPQVAVAAATALLGCAALSATNAHPIWRWAALEPELIWAACVELPALLLLFWLLGRMSATQMATRYLLTPLVAIAAGVLWLRPTLEPRTWLGLILTAAAALYLLIAPRQEDELQGLSLHPIRNSNTEE